MGTVCPDRPVQRGISDRQDPAAFAGGNVDTAQGAAHRRHLEWLATCSKWSMLDVFVVALLVVSVKLGALVRPTSVPASTPLPPVLSHHVAVRVIGRYATDSPRIQTHPQP